MKATKDTIKQISSLKRRADFLRLNKEGQKWVSRGLVIQAAPRPDPETADEIGFGITVTKKTFKSAVSRNRIKRRLRAVAADILSDHAKPGCDYVLIGRKETLDRSYDQLKKDVIWCLNKMGYAK